MRSGNPIIRISNIQNGKVIVDAGTVFVKDSIVSNLENYKLNIGDVLMALSGATTGKIGKVPEGLENSYLNQRVGRFLPNNEKLDASYLGLLLSQSGHLENIFANAFGSAIPNVSPSFLESLQIPLPPTIEEQRRIASVLDEQMKAVEGARLAVEAQLKAANLLPNAFLRVVFESEEAQNWQKRKLGEVCDVVAKLVDPKDEKYANLPHISSENIEGKTGRLLFAKSAKEDNVTSGKYLFGSGEVLYSKIRPYLRKVLVTENDGVCSADIYPIQVKPNSLDLHYLALILLSDEFTNYADEQSRRARMPKLNREQLFSWKISLPNTVEEQRKIVERINEQMQAAETLKKSLTEELEAVKKLPAALLRKAFAGEI